MDNGWIKIHRKIQEWEWYQNSKMVHLFLHFLTLANHEKGQWQGYTIERGQLITGLDSLHEKTGISTQSIRTCINKLKSTGEITSKSTNKFRIITLLKYDDYQIKPDKLTSKSTDKLTDNQQSTNNQLTANKKNKEEKEEIRKTSFSSLESFLDSPQKHIRLIGFFFKQKELKFSTPEEWTQAAKRWMRTAAAISKFDSDKITKAFDQAKQWPEWQLETVYKKLTGQNQNGDT